MLIGGPLPYAGPLATRDNVATTAKTVEQLGYDFVEVGEHLLYPKKIEARYPYTEDGSLPLDPSCNHLEIFTLLSFLAGQTSTLRLHSGILVLPYRSPFESAKMAATLDYLSGGRLTLGVGSGWMKDEFDILGVPWRERGRLTDEYLAVIRALFEGHAHFESDHYRFDDVYFEPKPVQSPLPMWIAGTSEAALRRVARYGQGWFPVTTPDGLKGYRDRLRYLLDEEQRELDSVEIVAPVFVDLEQRAQAAGHGVGISHPDRMLEAIAIWLDAGATAVHVFSSELYGNSLQQVFDEAQWFSEHVMPEARKLRATR